MKTFAILLAAFGASSASSRLPVPVIVGAEPGLDACMSLGAVSGLHHSLLNVREGPGTTFARVDSLSNGQELYLCTASPDEKWLGVVYMIGGHTPDCGVTSPLPSPQPYQGPCKFGWVHSKWISVIAG
jgi:hypothetical protein